MHGRKDHFDRRRIQYAVDLEASRSEPEVDEFPGGILIHIVFRSVEFRRDFFRIVPESHVRLGEARDARSELYPHGVRRSVLRPESLVIVSVRDGETVF